MSEQQNINVITDIYSAFGRGDVQGIIDRCTDDVLWRTHLDPVVPWAGDYDGRANIGRFFSNMMAAVEVTSFEPQEFIAQGDTVVSIGRFGCISRSTGKSDEGKWIFVWKLRDGKVCSYEQWHDASIAGAFRA